MHLISHNALPPGRRLTYPHIVAKIRPEKAETKRVRFTIGGNNIQYPGDSIPTSDNTLPSASSTAFFVYSRCTLHDDRHQRLLLEHFHGAVRVHAALSQSTSRLYHTAIPARTPLSTMASSSLKSAKACTVFTKPAKAR